MNFTSKELQWLPKEQETAYLVNNFQLSGSPTCEIHATFNGVSQTLMNSCLFLSDNIQNKLDQSRSICDALKSTPSITISKQSQAAADTEVKSNGANDHSGSNSIKKSGSSQSGKKRRKAIQYSNNNDEPMSAQLVQQWKNEFSKRQSHNAYVFARVSGLSNSNMQTLVGLEKSRVRYAMMYAGDRFAPTLSFGEFVQKIYQLRKHNNYSVFFRPLLKLVWQQYKWRGQFTDKYKLEITNIVAPVQKSDIKRCIKFFLKDELAGNKNYIFYGFEYDDLQYFFHSPLAALDDKPDSTAKIMAAGKAIMDQWNATDDAAYVDMKKKSLMARLHFWQLAHLFAPEEMFKIINEPDINVEAAMTTMVPHVLAQSTLFSYKALVDGGEDSKLVPYETVEALHTQLREYLIENVALTEKAKNATEWVKHAYHIIFDGYCDWLWCINHESFIHSQDKGLNYPKPKACEMLGNPRKFVKYTTHLSTFVLKWMRCTQLTSWAKRKTQKSCLKTVYPLRFQLLLTELKRQNGKFKNIVEFMCLLPDFVLCAFFEFVLGGQGLRIAHGVKSMVNTKGNWLLDEYWFNTPIVTPPSPPPILIGCFPPLEYAASTSLGRFLALRTMNKFPRIFINSKNMIAVAVNRFATGFNIWCIERKGVGMDKKKLRLLNKAYRYFGLPTCNINGTLEQAWAVYYKNQQKLQNKIVCFVKIGPPMNPNGSLAKWMYTNVKGYNQRMFEC